MTEHSARRGKKTGKPPLELELVLSDWSGRGAVGAEHDGRRLQIDRGIPGERVLATVDRRRKPWRGVVDAVLEASADRVDAPCVHYLQGCGGCQWQHVAHAAQIDAKRRLVDAEMSAAGVDAQVSRTHGMETPWRYRHTAALAIGWEAGFRARGRRGIVEIRDCPIAHPLIGSLADQLNQLLRAGAAPNYHGKVWLDCTAVGTPNDPMLQIVIQGIEGLTLETHPELPELAGQIATLGGVGTVAFRHRSGEPRPLVGDLMSQIEIAGRLMWLPAGSFCQTNVEMVAIVLRRIREAMRNRAPQQAADVYGGIGTFGVSLADEVGHMTLIEMDALAVEAAARTAHDWGLTNMTLISRHAERALGDLPPLDLLIVDPPRSGLGPTVCDAIVANGARLVAYVSCAPSSLARDLATLHGANFRVESLEMFDFYPQTYHVECLAMLAQ
ncbi:MAG: 23S rRNA (uracil(1939)-C(5))-methyltransferase RlmD [Chloroflexota bacterium]|nr:23S rRNA (uracil(1939)-C(5))-methyltransferase RlmD [Chloroflexota bacterium]